MENVGFCSIILNKGNLNGILTLVYRRISFRALSARDKTAIILRGRKAMAVNMVKLDLLVVEDEESICKEYEERVKKYPEFNYLGSTGNPKKALALCEKLHPGVLVLDLELREGGGNGFDFLRELKKLVLPFRPIIVVVTNSLSTTTHQTARQLGADFIITKSQKDYNIDMVLDLFKTYSEFGYSLDGNTTTDEEIRMQAAIEYRKKLKDRITEELNQIGISPRALGRKYLRDAIELTCDKKRANLNVLIAKAYGKTPASVERAMQNAISRAWSNTDPETLERQYTAYINPDKGEPTLMEFICYFADKIISNI